MLRRSMLAGFVMAAVLGSAGLAQAQVNVDIGIHLGSPPPLVDVFRRGAWYMAPRHDGPWAVVAPEYVPRPLLSVPVRYYRVPPPEWKGWHAEAAPHWLQMYGRRWEERREPVREEHRAEHREQRREEDRR